MKGVSKLRGARVAGHVPRPMRRGARVAGEVPCPKHRGVRVAGEVPCPKHRGVRVAGEVPCPIHDPFRRPARATGARPRACCCVANRRLPPGETRGSSAPRRGVGRAYELIYTVIEHIPRGRVATYGGIARLAGLPGHARQVGYALRVLPDGRDLPWHRVVNAKGEISARSDAHSEAIQRVRLEREGVALADGRVPLRRFQWIPAAARSSARRRD
jgi:methylated-DNA-protein-cysteine methyltransferase-like protein